MSIVKGNRVKFQLDDADVQAREDFIEMTRQQITAMRDEVQGASAQDSAGFSTKSSLGTQLVESDRLVGRHLLPRPLVDGHPRCWAWPSS